MPAIEFMAWFGCYLRDRGITTKEYAALIDEDANIVEDVFMGIIPPTNRILRALKMKECATTKERDIFIENAETELKWMKSYEESG